MARSRKPKTLFQGSQYFKSTSIINGKTVEDTELRENVDNNQQVIEGHIGPKPVHIRRKLGYPRSNKYVLVPYSKFMTRKRMNRIRRSLRNQKKALKSQAYKSQSRRKLKPLRFDI
jgi:hypothetical protein